MLAFLSVVFFLLQRFQPPVVCGYGDQACISRFNLDDPLADQYVSWVWATLHGNFGYSLDGQPVSVVLQQKLPPTVELVGCSFVLQQCLAIPLGVMAATRQYSRFDMTFSGAAYIALSFPGFVLGLLLMYVFCVRLQLLPVGHYESVENPLLLSSAWFSALASDPESLLLDLFRHLILPAFVLTVTGIAVDSRFTRAAMLQVLHQDYMRTARANGLTRKRIIFKHAFRNALPAVITNMALYLPTLTGSVIVVERVFTWGGLGYAFNAGLGSGDFPLVQAMLLMMSGLVLVANLLADLAYAWLDPRVVYD
jgi:peptide/nickel transport system permease protein